MSQDWIKLEKITLEKKEVARIATALRIDRYSVVGRLARLWAYFDSHTENGRLEGVDAEFLNELVGKKGFCEALILEGWLAVENAVIVLPNFDRHNGETAKKRALDANRQAKSRTKRGQVSQKTVTDVTKNCDGAHDQRRGEKRREEERREEGEQMPPQIDDATFLAQEFAFDGGDGTSPTATARARATMVDLLNAGFTRQQLFDEIKRTNRTKSEHPGDFRRRLMPDKKANGKTPEQLRDERIEADTLRLRELIAKQQEDQR